MVNPTHYSRTIPVLMVPHLWIGATFSPILLFLGIQDLTGYEFYLALFFIFAVSYSIREGFIARRFQIYSDFIMLAVIPILLPCALLLYLLLR